jgi:alkaline phosphatase
MKLLYATLITLYSTIILAVDKPNIIVVIGDGMGPAYITAFRNYQDNLATQVKEPLAFDDMLVGTMQTSLDDHEHRVITDSAAAATAIATGQKTFYKAVSVDKDKQPIKTTMETAREMGYQTGVVVLSSVMHATPAAFVAHDADRYNYNELADQYLDDRIDGKPKLDIIFGGGQRYFMRKSRDLLAGFKEQGYQTALNWSEFRELEQKPAIALLSYKGLPFELDSPEKNRLTQLTEKAFSLLNTEKPFYMLVEGSQIDWCGHNNDIACAMHEMADFEKTVQFLKKVVDENPNTLLVVTSDHSTGGLSVGANYELLYKGPSKKYTWEPEYIFPVKATVKSIAKQLLLAQKQWYEKWLELTSLTLTEQEKARFISLTRGYQLDPDISLDDLTDDHRPLLRALMIHINSIINGRSNTGWTSGGHTAVDVNVYSYGKYADKLRGNIDNTDIGKIIQSLLDEPSK